MNKEKEQVIFDFNNTLIDLCNGVAVVAPTSIVGKHIKDVCKMITNKQNKTKFIDIFVAKVLIYKDKIMAGDESYFLNKSYDKELESSDHNNSVFEFKDIWSSLKPDNKNLVIQYMQILCLLAEKYFTMHLPTM